MALPKPSGPSPGRLLVVDDEPFLRDAVAASLRFLGFEVTTGATGTEALSLTRDRPFDLVVLDVMLPDTDGFEVVRRLREHEETRTVPIVMLTEHTAEDDVLDGLSLGVDEYMPKPFSPHELSLRLARILARAGQAR